MNLFLKILAPIFIFMAMTCSAQADSQSDPIVTENYNESSVDSTSTSETTVISPPPSAISPTINTSNSDLCTVGVSGAVQTQILGISAGSTVRDVNCEKLKNAKTLYDMGMKVAAVSVMCQDPRVFTAMMNAGTPCPIDGVIGEAAKTAWEDPENESKRPDYQQDTRMMNIDQNTRTTLIGVGGVAALLALLLFSNN